MAYKDFEGLSTNLNTSPAHQTFQADSAQIELPDASFIRDAMIQRDGMDLVLDGPHGTITIDGYFAAEQAPSLVGPGGEMLTPNLVNSFATSPSHYAQNLSMSDESPVGFIQELSGEGTITHTDGSVSPLNMGQPVYEGDIIETASNGAVNITFSDESSFAVSEDSRVAIDEYVYDNSGAGEGSQNFSVLKGMFVFTSGLVGRDDPDDVHIQTPSGSIGIRGTIIAGDIDNGEVTVVEGAIVVSDFAGNEVTLDNQFETAKFLPQSGVDNIGLLKADEVSQKFVKIAKVAPIMFSSIEDSAKETPHTPLQPHNAQDPADAAQSTQHETDHTAASGTVDQDADNKVDGSLNEEPLAPQDAKDGETGEKGDTSGETGTPGPDAANQPDADMQQHKMPLHSDTHTAEEMAAIKYAMKMQSLKEAQMQTVSAAGGEDTLMHEGLQTPTAQNTLGTTEPKLLDTTQTQDNILDNNLPPPPVIELPDHYFTSNQTINDNGEWWSATTGNDTNVVLNGDNNTVNLRAGNDQITINGNNNEVTLESGADFAGITGDGNLVYGGQDDDTIIIHLTAENNQIWGQGGNNTFDLYGDNNTLYLGWGAHDEITVYADAHGNTILGREGINTYDLKTAQNTIIGGDNEDIFKMDAATINEISNNDFANFIKGGDSANDFDSLWISEDATLNFTLIDGDYFRNIEHIDLTHADVTIQNLTWDDIINMTDTDNKLYITGNDTNDHLTIVGDTADTQTAITENSINYDVYTNDVNGTTVTLYVENTIDATVPV